MEREKSCEEPETGKQKRGSKTATEQAFFQTRVMRLTNPNDELGGMLFLATPQIVSHRIDLWSPMFPPAARDALGTEGHDGEAYHFPGLVFREADREVAIGDEGGGTSEPSRAANGAHCMAGMARSATPPVRRSTSGELGAGMAADGSHHNSGDRFPRSPATGSHATTSQLLGACRDPDGCRCWDAVRAMTGRSPVRHTPVVRPAQAAGRATAPPRTDCASPPAPSPPPPHCSPPPQSTHRRTRLRSPRCPPTHPRRAAPLSPDHPAEMRKQIRQHIANSELEVVVIVEAIDPHSSNTFQARHSYTADDIVFDHAFASCMGIDEYGKAVLSWESFHRTQESPFNASQIIGGSHS